MPSADFAGSHHHPPAPRVPITSSHHQPLVAVALQAAGAPLPEPLTYTLPEALCGQAAFGSAVLVPLSRRELIGAIVGFPVEAPADLTLRPVLAVLDPAPAFDERLYRVAAWMAARYHCPLGEALPRIMPESHLISAERVVRLTGAWPEDDASLARWGMAMRGAAGRLRRLLVEADGEIEIAALKRRLPTPALSALLRQLRSRGWIEDEYRLRLPRAHPHTVTTWSLVRNEERGMRNQGGSDLSSFLIPHSSFLRLGERQQRVLEYFQARPESELAQPDLCRELNVTPVV